jgi:DNA-directed RNA polymerase subunit RPC12/RpoP
MTWRCVDCGEEDPGNLAPMLHDDVWSSIAKKDYFLCTQCMFKRATKRGVKITLASLYPCLFNLSGWPYSPFDLLRLRWPAEAPCPDIEAWRAVWRRDFAK